MKVPSRARRRAVPPSSSRRGRPAAGRAQTPQPPAAGPLRDRVARGPARPRSEQPPPLLPAQRRRRAGRRRAGICARPLRAPQPFLSRKGEKKKKKYTPNGCRKRRSRQSPPQRAASLYPSPRTGKKRKADRTKAISKSNVQPQPTLMRPPPRALRAAHAIPSRSPPPLTQRAPHGTIRTPAGSRELPQPPPRRPFIAAPISRGDGRGAPGPFLPSRLPGPPAGAA